MVKPMCHHSQGAVGVGVLAQAGRRPSASGSVALGRLRLGGAGRGGRGPQLGGRRPKVGVAVCLLIMNSNLLNKRKINFLFEFLFIFNSLKQRRYFPLEQAKKRKNSC